MRLRTVVLLLIFTFLGFLVCQHFIYNNDKAKTTAIVLDTPYPELIPEDSIFSFLAEEGFEYEFDNGTTIQIPAGTLTKANGALINGAVQLHIRFFNNALDLFHSGVLLNNGSSMIKTAGGFDIWVEKNEERLYLDPTQNIKIKLATYSKDSGYSLFKLNDDKMGWDSLYHVSPQINQEHVDLERQLRKSKPRIKFPLDDQYLAFNYKGILAAIYNNNRTNVNHPQTQKKMRNYGLRWPDINVDTSIAFQGNEVFASQLIWRNVSRKQIPKWTKKRPGKIEKIKGNRYRLVVEDSLTSRKFSTHLEAIMPLKELFSLGPGYWKTDYESKMKKRTALQLQNKYKPDSYRVFKIYEFGMYNWQMRYDEESPIAVRAFFKEHINKSLSESVCEQVCYLSGDQRGLMYYPKTSKELFLIYPDRRAKIFSYCPDGRIVAFSDEDMKLMEFDQLRKMDKPSFLFKMEMINQAKLQDGLVAEWLLEP